MIGRYCHSRVKRSTYIRLTSAMRLPVDPNSSDLPSKINISFQQPATHLDQANHLDRLKEKHPNVRFWTQASWKEWEKSPTGQASPHGTLGFLENYDGSKVTEDMLVAMSCVMRGLWFSFKHRGDAPKTWGSATNTVKQEFYNEMVKTCGWLGLCASNWKIEAVATQRYASWAQTHLNGQGRDASGKQKATVKTEGSLEPDTK